MDNIWLISISLVTFYTRLSLLCILPKNVTSGTHPRLRPEWCDLRHQRRWYNMYWTTSMVPGPIESCMCWWLWRGMLRNRESSLDKIDYHPYHTHSHFPKVRPLSRAFLFKDILCDFCHPHTWTDLGTLMILVFRSLLLSPFYLK